MSHTERMTSRLIKIYAIRTQWLKDKEVSVWDVGEKPQRIIPGKIHAVGRDWKHPPHSAPRHDSNRVLEVEGEEWYHYVNPNKFFKHKPSCDNRNPPFSRPSAGRRITIIATNTNLAVRFHSSCQGTIDREATELNVSSWSHGWGMTRCNFDWCLLPWRSVFVTVCIWSGMSGFQLWLPWGHGWKWKACYKC